MAPLTEKNQHHHSVVNLPSREEQELETNRTAAAAKKLVEVVLGDEVAKKEASENGRETEGNDKSGEGVGGAESQIPSRKMSKPEVR